MPVGDGRRKAVPPSVPWLPRPGRGRPIRGRRRAGGMAALPRDLRRQCHYNLLMDTSCQPSTVRRWRPDPRRRAAASLLYPLVWAVNRPSMAWFGRLAYDMALRFNGIAINWKGRHGLTIGEEKLLRRLAPTLAGQVVLDVGANSGDYSRFVAQVAPTARILAFEPHPRTFATLSARVPREAVEPLNIALGDREGRLQLHDFAASDGSTQASLSLESVRLYGEGTVSHDVTCTTLDAFMAERGIERIAYLKIDTEGHDLAVLRGAARALRERRLDAIQFEFISANIATGVRMRDFFDVLGGYRIHRLCLNGALMPLDYDVRRTEIYVNQNLVALRA